LRYDTTTLNYEEPTWRITFGSDPLCTRDGTTVILQRVRLGPGAAPISMTPWLRTVSAAQGTGGGDYIPIHSAAGSPPEFDEPYAEMPVAGHFAQVKGERIQDDCQYDLSRGYSQLLLSVEVDQRGASADYLFIDYTDGVTEYSLRTPYSFELCGSATEPRCKFPGGG
jgi:hypothetical protein